MGDARLRACFYRSVSTRRVMLRVKAEVGCPLFRAGDQMVVDLPAIDTSSSNAVCALALAKFLKDGLLEACQETPSPQLRGEFRCPRKEQPVIFDVESVAQKESTTPLTGDLTHDIPGAVANLRSVPIFRALPATYLGKLAQRIAVQTFGEGETILQKGYPGEAFYVVMAGAVKVIAYADGDISSVVRRLGEKDCFGEMSLLTGAPCAASVVAQGPVTVYALSQELFEDMLRENPFMASRFTRLMASRLMAANFLLVKEGAKSFSGKLSMMNLATVVQVLADSSRSGVLRVRGEDEKEGYLAINQGRLFDARLGEIRGEEAFFGLLGWKVGDFWLDAGPIPQEDRIQTGLMGLLLEGMRRIDEANRDEQEDQLSAPA